MFGDPIPYNPGTFTTTPLLTPRVKRDLYAKLFDRFAPQGGYDVEDGDKKRLFRQGLLQFAANVSKPNGGNFANAVATGLLAGSQGMNQGVDDMATRQYRNASLQAGPSAFRAAHEMALATGAMPGTPEYQHFMRVQGGIDARQSNAAIQYKQQMGEDGVMRYIALDPNDVGATAIGTGQTFGAPVGGQPPPQYGQPPVQYGQPQGQPTPPNNEIEGIIENMRNDAQQGGYQFGPQQEQAIRQQFAQTGEFNVTNLPQAQPMPAQQMPPQARPMPQPMAGPSPFQSRPQEQQKALEALATARATNQASREQIPYDIALAGGKEQATQAAQVATIPVRNQYETQLAGSRKSAEMVAERRTQAQTDLPGVISKADQALAVIDKALKHPGRAAATGASSKFDPRNLIPGTDAYDFGTVSDQLQGKAFLEAFTSLKGGGQITEVEGKKATDAIARLNRAQSDAEYVRSLNDLAAVVRTGVARAQRQAGAKPDGKTIKRTGRYGGRKVIEYTDGSVEYAN